MYIKKVPRQVQKTCEELSLCEKIFYTLLYVKSQALTSATSSSFSSLILRPMVR